jgi:hypothetical protein
MVSESHWTSVLRASGFTLRQARFLGLVLEHSGVCLPRQYRAFAGVAHGRHAHAFFAKLIAGGFATTDLSAPAHGGRIYHVQYKPWYRALGEPDHRHRKPMSVGRAVERLMVLDAVLAEPDVTWLGLARDKVAAFTAPPFSVPPDALPHTTVGGVARAFPDPFPIGLAPGGSCLFLYLVTTPLPTTFWTFLTRHVPLLSALGSWRLRLLIPPALSGAEVAYIRTVHQVLEPVVRDDIETCVELVPVTHSYLRLEQLVGTA